MSWRGLLQMHSQAVLNFYHLIASNVCLIRHITVCFLVC